MLPEITFKRGDVVRLKTGGSAMNVTGTNDFSQEVFGEWFASDLLQKGQFHVTSVELTAPDAKAAVGFSARRCEQKG